MNIAGRIAVLIGLVGIIAVLILIFAPNEQNPGDTLGDMTGKLILSSPAFSAGGTIPERFSCDGENVNPPLVILNVPDGTKSLALIMDDPDIPEVFKQERGIEAFDHWTLFNISPDVSQINVGEAPGIQGANGRGETAYTGPCPPPEYKPTTHRYFFKLFALDTELPLEVGATKADVLAAIEGKILAQTELIGTYDRSGN